MGSGWVIEVEDIAAKDYAYKLMEINKQLSDSKRCDLQKRYDAIESQRFRLTSNTPYSEVDSCSRVVIKVSNVDDVHDLFDLSPLILKRDDDFFYVEIDGKAV